MSTRPDQAVAFLKDKLKPLMLDSVRLKAYLLRLGSPNEKPLEEGVRGSRVL